MLTLNFSKGDTATLESCRAGNRVTSGKLGTNSSCVYGNKTRYFKAKHIFNPNLNWKSWSIETLRCNIKTFKGLTYLWFAEMSIKHLLWRLRRACKENHTISTVGSRQSRLKHYRLTDCFIFVSQRNQIVDSDWKCVVGVRRKDKHPDKWLNHSLISVTNSLWQFETFFCEKPRDVLEHQTTTLQWIRQPVILPQKCSRCISHELREKTHLINIHFMLHNFSCKLFHFGHSDGNVAAVPAFGPAGIPSVGWGPALFDLNE